MLYVFNWVICFEHSGILTILKLSILTLGSVAAGVAIPKVLGSNDAKKNVPAKPAPPVAQSKEDDFDLEKFIKYVSLPYVSSISNTNNVSYSELTKEETK